MKAIIVCEGFEKAKSLESSEYEFYPPLVKLRNGETVFGRQIRLLNECGVTKFVISAVSHRERLAVIIDDYYKHLEFTWTDGYDHDSILSVSVSQTPVEEETIIISGGLVFNKKYITRFLSPEFESAVALKSGNMMAIVDGYIAAKSDEEDTNVYEYDLLPLWKLVKSQSCKSKIRAVVAEEDYIEELHDDIEYIQNEISYFDLTEQNVIYGSYSFFEIDKIFKSNQVNKPMVICRSIQDMPFVKMYLDSMTIPYVLYETSSQTPDYNDILKEAKRYASEQCDLILSIGEQAQTDAAKMIKLMVASNKARDNFQDLSTIKHIAVTAGTDTGTEAIPTAAYIKDGTVQTLSHEGLLPDYVILEPKFIDDLNEDEKKVVLIDTLCLLVESFWANNSDSRSRILAELGLTTLLDYLFQFLSGEIESYSYIMYARHLCAKAVYRSGVTMAYAAGQKIADLYKIPVSHAASLCAPYFWLHYSENLFHSSDKANRKKAAEVSSIVKDLFGAETNFELKEMMTYLVSQVFGIEWPKALDANKVYELANALTEGESGDNTPVLLGSDDIAKILFESFNKDHIWRADDTLIASDPLVSWKIFMSNWKSTLSAALLRRTKQVELEILDETVRLCEDNGLQYFLSYGTLLGAARHKGFIPWNDNIEISMPKKDYRAFLSIAEKQLAPQYYVHNSVNDPYCWFNETRVCKTNTLIEKSRERFFYAKQRGIYISVCPLGSIKHKRGRIPVIRNKAGRLINALIEYRLNKSSRKLRFRARFIMRLLSPLSIKQMHKLESRITSGQKGDYAVLGHRYSAQQEIIHKNKIFPLARLDFEGKQYNVPKDWHAVLTQLYGDYQTLPSEEMQKINRPIRTAFEPNRIICFRTGKGSGDWRIPPDLFDSNKYKLTSKMKKIIRGLFGPTRLPKRTMTRIGGFFRTIGIRPSKNSQILASYKDKYKGQRCFLIGNGPSLKAEDLDRLKDEVTIGCNLIYKIFDQTVWRPTFYCVSDSGITRNHSRELVENIDCTTLMIREFAYRYMEVKPWDAVKLPYISVDWYKVRGNMLAYHYISHATVMSMMIELAMYMGFKDIYLLGVDGTSASAKGSHFIDTYFSKAMKEYGDNIKKRIYKNYDPAVRAAYLQKRTLDIFAIIREYAEKNGFHVYNATRGGVIEVFERRDIDNVLDSGREDS